MKKRLLLITLVIMLTMGTVVQSEMRAEAAATTTVTVVGIAKAVMILLAIAGVGIGLGTIFDNNNVDESTVQAYLDWLNQHDPEQYTAFMLAATAIAAGRTVNTLDKLFFHKVRENVREYFGETVGEETAIGTYSTQIPPMTAGETLKVYFSYRNNGGGQYIVTFDRDMYIVAVPVQYSQTYPLMMAPYYIFYIPTEYVGENDKAALLSGMTFKKQFETDWSVPTPELRQISSNAGYVIEWHFAYSSPITSITYDKDHLSLPSQTVGTTSYDIYTNVVAPIVAKIRNGGGMTQDSVLTGAPLAGVGGIAATSADSMVVGAGQTLTRDENGDIVVDGGLTFGLQGVDIDTLLRGLAEGTITYEQAMAILGLAAVNTQTQTLEQIQTIAEALNPAAARTDRITGQYTVALTDLFPFCIPFDLYAIIKCFQADPVAPSAEITIPVGYDGNSFTWETYTVSLAAFDPVAAVVRVLEYVGFVIGLMLITRKLIEG